MNKIKFPILSLLLLLSAACIKTNADVAREKEQETVQKNMNQNIAEHSENLDQMQANIGKIQGKVEEFLHSQQKEKEKQQELLNGLAAGFSKLELQQAEIRKKQRLLFEEIKKIKRENIRKLTTRSSRRSKKSPSFARALGYYKKRSYGRASKEFQAFVQKHPRSKNYIQANLYLGNSLFFQKMYDRAILAYSRVYEKASKKSQSWRKATLKIAESFQKKRRRDQGALFANELNQVAPKSAEARRAKKMGLVKK